MDVFDHVIVGGGTAASIVAFRLSEAGKTVCVLEAGPRDTNPYIRVPAGFIKTLFDPSVTWQFATEPSAGTNERRLHIAQGRTLGGSSSVNGMIYNRGQAADFDSWAQLGNGGWNYDDILPYFKRTERRIGEGEDDFRGRNGRLTVTTNPWRHPLCDAFIEGAREAGFPFNPDYNGRTQAGVGLYQSAVRGRWRVSTASAFLRPAERKNAVSVRTKSRAVQILLEGNRAVGVRYERERTPGLFEVRARESVIVSAGAINSPKLLQLSGIGPASLLRAHGIEVRCDLAGVGENLHDHFSPRLVLRAKNTDSINDRVRGVRLGLEIARWMAGRPSVLTLSPAVVHVFGKSDSALDNPDFSLVFAPGSYKQGFVGRLDDFSGMTCGAWQMRPESAGYVRITSAQSASAPAIQPNYLKEETDRKVLVAGLKAARRIFAMPAVARYVAEELLPGKDVSTDEEWLSFARQYGMSSYHLTGSCKMGPRHDPTAVVDDRLRVHGVDGLHVVDSSVMPTPPSANTYASTMMVAEKGADLVLGRTPLAPVRTGGAAEREKPLAAA